jgi:hypothetical protein
VKKFSLMVVALVAVFAWSGTASAQCGGRFFGGHRGNGCGIFHGGGLFHHGGSCGTYSCGPTYSGCNSGYVVVGQTDYSGGKKVMPSPTFQPYQGTPKTNTEELPLPPKKIQPPNPKQEGFPSASNILYINGIPHGRLGDGSYASLSDGTYYRLMPSYGSYQQK